MYVDYGDTKLNKSYYHVIIFSNYGINNMLPVDTTADTHVNIIIVVLSLCSFVADQPGQLACRHCYVVAVVVICLDESSICVYSSSNITP